LPARIRACTARPGLAKCGGRKQYQGRKPDCCFLEPEPPDQGGEQLPFVMCSAGVHNIFYIFS